MAMILKAERDEIRVRSEAAINTWTQIYSESSIWFKIQQDIYKMLDALDEMDKPYPEILEMVHSEMEKADVFAADVVRFQELWKAEKARADKAERELIRLKGDIIRDAR